MALPKAIHTGLVTLTWSTEIEALGTKRYGTDGKVYQFVKLIDLDGAVNKMTYMTPTDYQVTIDATGGTALAILHATGMLLATVDISVAPYCWVQIEGETTFTAGSASIIAGDYLMPDTSEDGDLTEATAGTNANICAIASAVVADNATGLCKLKNIVS